MTNFAVHTVQSGPERSQPALKQLQSTFGVIPNLIGAMATSPVLINSLVGPVTPDGSLPEEYKHALDPR